MVSEGQFVGLPQKRPNWMHSHLQLPTPWVFSDGSVRVFFASRDKLGRSHVGALDMQRNLSGIWNVRFLNEPVLQPGELGSWSQDGIFPSSIIEISGRFYLYTIGWNKACEAPIFYASIGVVEADSNFVFQEKFPGPILSRGRHEPLFVTAPSVFRISDGKFGMSYVSGIEWVPQEGGPPVSRYEARLAMSNDGLEWEANGQTMLGIESDERNISRSFVHRSREGGYQAWFSVTKAPNYTYQLAHAISADGITWIRDDSALSERSKPLFDGRYLAYPAVFSLGGEEFVLWNDKGFGSEGFWISPI